jgi:hypothetical protein
MSCEPPRWFLRTFSAARLTPYQEAARRGSTHVEDLYRWNLQVSEAFYPALSCLETSLRNAIHERLQARYQRPDWWESAPLDKHDAAKVRQAADDLSRRRGLSAQCADSIVAELSFGFWVYGAE